jgi:hypothetical protein
MMHISTTTIYDFNDNVDDLYIERRSIFELLSSPFWPILVIMFGFQDVPFPPFVIYSSHSERCYFAGFTSSPCKQLEPSSPGDIDAGLRATKFTVCEPRHMDFVLICNGCRLSGGTVNSRQEKLDTPISAIKDEMFIFSTDISCHFFFCVPLSLGQVLYCRATLTVSQARVPPIEQILLQTETCTVIDGQGSDCMRTGSEVLRPRFSTVCPISSGEAVNGWLKLAFRGHACSLSSSNLVLRSLSFYKSHDGAIMSGLVMFVSHCGSRNTAGEAKRRAV